MAIDSGVGGVVFLLGRLLFGLAMAYMGLNHFRNADTLAGYADANGIPAPRAGVLVSGGMLVLGGLGIVLGVLPVLSAGAIAVFLLVSSFTVHDYWAAPDDQKQNERTQFLKNVGLTGAALGFLVVGGQTWAYAVNYSVF
ncbi:DoxX family membrane protein [Halocalculus aciditolerans]|uniref:Terminal quinol oxidase subunit n=1 Tax=Halocalculus aciditolerans TaxID=1383812 RepID=A0A830FCR4_9EURY|nr:DoxX family membrane protein [Halocalculus aciditolerans]GGL62521.1 hypothetical protein GCM10009039_20710 [Halocalculus aciditolerans]